MFHQLSLFFELCIVAISDIHASFMACDSLTLLEQRQPPLAALHFPCSAHDKPQRVVNWLLNVRRLRISQPHHLRVPRVVMHSLSQFWALRCPSINKLSFSLFAQGSRSCCMCVRERACQKLDFIDVIPASYCKRPVTHRSDKTWSEGLLPM